MDESDELAEMPKEEAVTYCNVENTTRPVFTCRDRGAETLQAE
jgi:hypothetical protein